MMSGDLETRVAQARALAMGTPPTGQSASAEAQQRNILLIRKYLPLRWTDDGDEGRREILRQLAGLNFTAAPIEYHWVRAGKLDYLEYDALISAVEKANPAAVLIRRINGLGTTEYSVSLTSDQKATFEKVPDALVRLLTGAIGEPLKSKGIMLGDTVVLMVSEAIQSQASAKSLAGSSGPAVSPQYFSGQLL